MIAGINLILSQSHAVIRAVQALSMTMAVARILYAANVLVRRLYMIKQGTCFNIINTPKNLSMRPNITTKPT